MRWTHNQVRHKRQLLALHRTIMAEESLIPSLSEGVVGSRFITQDEVETAKQRREEQWKAAYARSVSSSLPVALRFNPNYSRLGQEPPPQQQEEVYDGRSLAEVSLPITDSLTSCIHFRCWFQHNL